MKETKKVFVLQISAVLMCFIGASKVSTYFLKGKWGKVVFKTVMQVMVCANWIISTILLTLCMA